MPKDYLRKLVAATTTGAIAQTRITIDDDRAAGRLAAATASALQVIAALVAAELPEVEVPTSKAPAPAWAPAGDRLPGVIREAVEADYPDSGPVIRGTVAVQTADGEVLVRFRILRSWEGSIKAIFHSCGLHSTDPAGSLAGHEVLVELGSFTGQDGNERPVVKRWHKAQASKPATPKAAVSDVPAWQADDADPRPEAEAAARAPRRTSNAKARAEFRQTSGDDGDSIPFSWLVPLITALAGAIV